MHTSTALRAIAAAALTAALTALTGVTCAQAAEAPPTSSTGILAEAWGAPIVNDLFEVSTSSWTASTGTSPDGVTTAAVTVTAVQDIDFRLSSWYGGTPERITSHVSGTCPASIFSPIVAMTAGDQCSIWVTYGDAYTNSFGSVVSDLSMSASTTAGGTATASVPLNLTTGQLLVNGLLNGTGVIGLGDTVRQPVDFGEVMVGGNAERSFTVTNVSSEPVRVDMTGVAATGPFSRGTGVGDTLTIDAGQTVTVPVFAAPTSTGARSTWREKLHVSTVDGTVTSTATAPDLKVTGVARTLSVTAEDVDFGRVSVGETTSRDLLITNTGTGTVTVDATSIDPDVAVEVPTASIEPGAAVRATVTWTASALGTLTDTVQITATDQPSPGVEPAAASELTAAVTGEAVAAVVPPTPEPVPTATASPTTPPTTVVAADPAPVAQGVLAVTGARVALAAALAVGALAAGITLLVLRRRARG